MALSLHSYLCTVREALTSALSIRNLPSQVVEKHNKPVIETKESKELLLIPLTIARSEFETCFIEPSINSVRISFTIKKAKEIDILLAHLCERFISLRADKFEILRKKAIEGFDFSFLVTNIHLEKFHKEHMINFILQFMQDIEIELNDIKLKVIHQLRIAAEFFTNEISCQLI